MTPKALTIREVHQTPDKPAIGDEIGRQQSDNPDGSIRTKWDVSVMTIQAIR
jgi:hypothetical protein